jgi:hypothetical protein
MLRLGSEADTYNIDYLLTLPGTIKLPDQAERKKGRGVCQIKLIYCNETTCKLDDIPPAPALGKPAPQAAAATSAKAKPTGPSPAPPTVGATNDAPLFDPWQPFVVPAFPLDVLPDGVQAFVTSQSDVIGCDPSLLAMGALANFSAALDHRFKLKMMRHGDWYARPALWILLVGASSVKKTPPMKAALYELNEIQNALRESYEVQLEAIKKAGNIQEPPPKPPRYIVHDTSTPAHKQDNRTALSWRMLGFGRLLGVWREQGVSRATIAPSKKPTSESREKNPNPDTTNLHPAGCILHFHRVPIRSLWACNL